MKMETRKFTEIELRNYNGQDGAPVYIAYRGKVYDVSRSFLWRCGEHQALHLAGLDLTLSLKKAPHGVELLEKFPIVGIMPDGIRPE